jgi:hypothetical protein
MGSSAGLAGCLPLVILVLSLFFVDSTLGQPAVIDYQDCFSSTGNTTGKLNVSVVYAQISDNNRNLNFTIIGQSNIPIIGRLNDSTKLGEFPSKLP